MLRRLAIYGTSRTRCVYVCYGCQYLLQSAWISTSSATDNFNSKEAASNQIKHLQEQALSGSAVAQYELSTIYYEGNNDIKKDYHRAKEFAHQAALNGYTAAYTRLGLLYLLGYGVDRDSTIALQHFAKAAERGDADSQNHLASMLLRGIGCRVDRETAIRWYEASAQQRNMKAALSLAKILLVDSEYNKRDYVRALKLLEIAIDNNNAEAQYLAALLYNHQHPIPLDIRGKDAPPSSPLVSSLPSSSSLLSSSLRADHHFASIPLNRARSWSLLSYAADQDHRDAQRSLGDYYRLYGNYKEDESSAVYWYRKAADQGDTMSQCRLGFFYYYGIMGLEADQMKAIQCLTTAAEGQYIEAQFLLCVLIYENRANKSSIIFATPNGKDTIIKQQQKQEQLMRHYLEKIKEEIHKQYHIYSSNDRTLIALLSVDTIRLGLLWLATYESNTGQKWIGDMRQLLEGIKSTPWDDVAKTLSAK